MSSKGFDSILKDCMEKGNKKDHKDMDSVLKTIEKMPTAGLLGLFNTSK